MMTKKDFQILANNLVRIENFEERARIINIISDACKESNPKFDKQKFIDWIVKRSDLQESQEQRFISGEYY